MTIKEQIILALLFTGTLYYANHKSCQMYHVYNQKRRLLWILQAIVMMKEKKKKERNMSLVVVSATVHFSIGILSLLYFYSCCRGNISG